MHWLFEKKFWEDSLFVSTKWHTVVSVKQILDQIFNGRKVLLRLECIRIYSF